MVQNPPALTVPYKRTGCGARRSGHLAIANPAATEPPCFRNRPVGFAPAEGQALAGWNSTS